MCTANWPTKVVNKPPGDWMTKKIYYIPHLEVNRGRIKNKFSYKTQISVNSTQPPPWDSVDEAMRLESDAGTVFKLLGMGWRRKAALERMSVPIQLERDH